MRKNYLRKMAISVFIIGLSFFNFYNITDSECVKAIHIVTLLVCGIGMGFLFISFLGWLKAKKG